MSLALLTQGLGDEQPTEPRKLRAVSTTPPGDSLGLADDPSTIRVLTVSSLSDLAWVTEALGTIEDPDELASSLTELKLLSDDRKVPNQFGLYQQLAKVTDPQLEAAGSGTGIPKTLDVEEAKANRRRSERYHLYHLEGAKTWIRNPIFQEVTICDLSTSGVSIETSNRLEIGSCYTTVLELFGVSLSTVGKVAWSKVAGSKLTAFGHNELLYRVGLRLEVPLSDELSGILMRLKREGFSMDSDVDKVPAPESFQPSR